MLFVQGRRDAFGTPAELKPVLEKIAPSPALHVADGGDHSFKLAGRDLARQMAIYSDVQRAAAEWMRSITRSS